MSPGVKFESAVESNCAKMVFALRVGEMSIHSDHCVPLAATPEGADAACAETFEVVSGVIRDGGTLTAEQLQWAKRHGGLLGEPDTDAVTKWLRDRRR